MRWLPLESNPDVMNAWASALGLSTDQVFFTDIYGLDDDLLSMVPQPVYAVLMLFPISEEYEADRFAEHARISEARDKLDAEALTNEDQRVLFIKQTISNACGTMGLLHALGNNPEIPITDGPLTAFFEKCKSKSPVDRAQLLETDLAIANVHSDLAQTGQSRVPDQDEKVDLHFVCFVQKSGRSPEESDRLVELDGRKAFPIDHGPIESDLLHAVVPVVKKFIALSKDNLQFNLIALCPTSA